MREAKDSKATGRRLPSTEQGRRTRAAIVAAAGQLMYERGVAATSLDDVLSACGAGKSQLYHYFGGKQELVTAVIDHQLRRILANQPRLQHLESWEDFDGWVTDLLALNTGPAGPAACPLGSLAGELDDDPGLCQELDAAFRTWESHLARGLERLRERGLLRDDADPARLAAATMAALQGGLMMAHLRRDITPLDDALTMALNHLRAHRP